MYVEFCIIDVKDEGWSVNKVGVKCNYEYTLIVR